MEDITIILLVASILLYLVTIILPKRMEIVWLAVIVSVCSMGGIILDNTVVDQELALLLIPNIFILLMSGLKAMGILEKW